MNTRWILAGTSLALFSVATWGCLEGPEESQDGEDLGTAEEALCTPGTWSPATCGYAPGNDPDEFATQALLFPNTSKTLKISNYGGTGADCPRMATVAVSGDGVPWTRITVQPYQLPTTQCECEQTAVKVQARNFRNDVLLSDCTTLELEDGACTGCTLETVCTQECPNPECSYWNQYDTHNPNIQNAPVTVVTGTWNTQTNTCSLQVNLYENSFQPIGAVAENGAEMAVSAYNTITRVTRDVNVTVRNSTQDAGHEGTPHYGNCCSYF